MVLWKTYKGKQSIKEIIDKVGMQKNSNTSNKFLVMAGFEGSNKFEPHFACAILHKNQFSFNIIIYSLQGRTTITHWTEIKTPKNI